MNAIFAVTCAVLLGSFAAPRGDASIICCGASEVFVLPADGSQAAPEDRTWRWTAADSPEIPERCREWFRTTDDCKPYGKDRETGAILITSSSGGVALIKRSDKSCRFLAYARNAHTACLLPGGLVAVASSNGGDELLLFRLTDTVSDPLPGPVARLPFKSAHGLVWDAKLQRLWALGYDHLARLELRHTADAAPELVQEAQFPLPSPGGHDLRPSLDEQQLFVTTESNVFVFDKQSGAFQKESQLGEMQHIKSCDQHPQSGAVVYHQASDDHWWSDTIRFLDEKRTLTLPAERLYKIRWDVPAEVPSAREQGEFVSAPEGYFDAIKAELQKDWPRNRRVVFVAHGHSVPAGYFKTPAVRTFEAYPSVFHQQLADAYPSGVIEMIVTAIGGEQSPRGAERFADDVLAVRPDVVLIDYALNDRGPGLEAAEQAWRAMIEAAQAKQIRVILLTPTPDTREDILDDKAPLAQHSEQIRRLAAEYKVALVDNYAMLKSKVVAGAPVTDFLSQVNHPNAAGHKLVAELLMQLWEEKK